MRSCALIVLGGCMGYNAGSFKAGGVSFVGKHVELACLDLAVAVTDDARAGGPVIAYTFGNHCNHAVTVDLASVRAYGRYANGSHPLRAFDPRRELRPLRIPPDESAGEEIEYLDDQTGGMPAATCVDVGGVDRSELPTAPHWMCFGTWDLGAQPFGPSDPAAEGATASTAIDWPLSPEPEPEVAAMPTSIDTIEGVGAYFALRIKQPWRLVKALHDYVVARMSYDTETSRLIDAERWMLVPSQEAEDVFARRRGVCAGYAHLLVALGRAAHVDIAYVTGIAGGGPHAWNAANIDGRWLLIDATWDDTDSDGPSEYYLFTPPGLFAKTHVPDEPRWSLVEEPYSLDQLARGMK